MHSNTPHTPPLHTQPVGFRNGVQRWQVHTADEDSEIKQLVPDLHGYHATDHTPWRTPDKEPSEKECARHALVHKATELRTSQTTETVRQQNEARTAHTLEHPTMEVHNHDCSQKPNSLPCTNPRVGSNSTADELYRETERQRRDHYRKPTKRTNPSLTRKKPLLGLASTTTPSAKPHRISALAHVRGNPETNFAYGSALPPATAEWSEPIMITNYSAPQQMLMKTSVGGVMHASHHPLPPTPPSPYTVPVAAPSRRHRKKDQPVFLVNYADRSRLPFRMRPIKFKPLPPRLHARNRRPPPPRTPCTDCVNAYVDDGYWQLGYAVPSSRVCRRCRQRLDFDFITQQHLTAGGDKEQIAREAARRFHTLEQARLARLAAKQAKEDTADEERRKNYALKMQLEKDGLGADVLGKHHADADAESEGTAASAGLACACLPPVHTPSPDASSLVVHVRNFLGRRMPQQGRCNARFKVAVWRKHFVTNSMLEGVVGMCTTLTDTYAPTPHQRRPQARKP